MPEVIKGRLGPNWVVWTADEEEGLGREIFWVIVDELM